MQTVEACVRLDALALRVGQRAPAVADHAFRNLRGESLSELRSSTLRSRYGLPASYCNGYIGLHSAMLCWAVSVNLQ